MNARNRRWIVIRQFAPLTKCARRPSIEGPGKLDGHDRPRTFACVDKDPPAMRGDNRLADAQSQARARGLLDPLTRPVSAEKSLEDMRQVGRGNTAPSIRHAENCRPAFAKERDANRTPRGSELNRVVQQVVDHLPQVITESHHGKVRIYGVDEFDLAGFCDGAEHLGTAREDEATQIDLFAVRANQLRVGLGEQQELVDEPFERRAFADDLRKQLLIFLRSPVAADGHFDRAANGRQRRAEFVQLRIRQQIIALAEVDRNARSRN